MKNTIEDKINDGTNVIEQKNIEFFKRKTKINKMPVGPTIESPTGMGLLGKKETVITELITLRDEKRKTYFDKFYARNGRVKDLRNVKWGLDGDTKDCGYRCNANIVLMEIGAKIPASEDGNRDEKEVAPIYHYPLQALGEWGLDHLTCSHSTYKGMDRVLISEPSRMPVPRFYEYLPKKIHDIRNEECDKFVTEFTGANAGLKREYVTVRFLLMRCNFAMNHRSDVEDHTYYTHGLDINELRVEAIIKVNEAEALVLTPALNFKDLSKEGRQSVFDSWFDSCTANGTVTSVENKENAKIQRHKAGNLLKALKASIGNNFFKMFTINSKGI